MYVKSQHLLSPNQYYFITSQHNKLSPSFNKSQDLKRIEELIEQCHYTIDLLLKSKAIDLDYKDKLFNAKIVIPILRLLTQHDPEKQISETYNSQAIAKSMINLGVAYYELRYKNLQIVNSKIFEFRQLLNDIDEFSSFQRNYENNLRLQMRRKKVAPPKINRTSEWQAVCMGCLEKGCGIDDSDAINKVIHYERCLYDEKEKDRWIKIYPPKGKQVRYD